MYVMTDRDKIARMYQIMARLSEIEREREQILRAREYKAWAAINARSIAADKAWVTRRANLALRRKAA